MVLDVGLSAGPNVKRLISGTQAMPWTLLFLSNLGSFEFKPERVCTWICFTICFHFISSNAVFAYLGLGVRVFVSQCGSSVNFHVVANDQLGSLHVFLIN